MTRRQLRSVATALRDVHVPLHSATSVSSWLLFRRQSAAARFHCNDLLKGLVCRYAAIQSDYVREQCMTFLVYYVSDVRQASCISYVDVLHVILPLRAFVIIILRTVTHIWEMTLHNVNNYPFLRFHALRFVAPLCSLSLCRPASFICAHRPYLYF